MSRTMTILAPAVTFSLCLWTAPQASAQGFRDLEKKPDDPWNYHSNDDHAPNPRAIIRQRAIERAAHRHARLEAQNYAGEHRMRPRVNPIALQGNWSTLPYGYVYGPPLVANDWGNTQISVLGDGSGAMMRNGVARRANVWDNAGPYLPR